MNITNIIDILTLLIIILFGVIGFSRGFFKQTFSTIGFIIIVVLAWYIKSPIGDFMCTYLPFFKFGGSLSGAASLNIILYQLIAFIITVALLEGIFHFILKITGLLEKILKLTIVLGLVSKIFGLILGLIEGFIIVFIALFFLKQPAFNISQFKDSDLANNILDSTPILSNISSEFVDTFDDIYTLTNDYINQKLDSNEMNYKAIEVMLDKKVVKTDLISKLVKKEKINVVGIDKLLKEYSK